jgi:diguanylate cyclase
MTAPVRPEPRQDTRASRPPQRDNRRDARPVLRLQTRLTLWLLPMIVAPLLLVGWFAYMLLHEQLQAQHLARMETLLDQMELHLQSKVHTAEANARLMMAGNLFQNYMRAEDEHERYELLYGALLRLLESYQQAYPDMREVRLALPDGSEDVRWVRSGSEPVSGLPTAALLESSEDSVRLVTDVASGEGLLLVTRRVMLRDVRADPVAVPPRHYGYLLLLLDLELLGTQMAAYRDAGQAELMVISRSGAVSVSGPSDTAAGTRLREAVPAEVLAAALDDLESGVTMATLRAGADFYQLRALPPDHLWVARVSDASMRAMARELAWVVALAVAATTVGTFLLILLALRVLVLRPLAALQTAALRLGGGEWDLPLQERGRDDEIGALERTFGDMVRQLRESHDQIRHLAYHDELTGLPNRKLFSDQLARAVAHARRRGETLAVLFADLDRFKEINDRHGHEVGDRVLRHFAALLSASVRGDDCVARVHEPDGVASSGGEMVARLGGDEFIVLLRDVERREDVIAVTDRLLRALELPFEYRGLLLTLRSSIGVAFYPRDADDSGELMRRADLAMYRAKQDTHRVWFYEDVVRDKGRELLDLQ